MVKVINDSVSTVRFSAWNEEVSGLVSGALVGVVTWLLTYGLSQYVVGQIACQAGSSIISCDSAISVSATIALIIASVVGLILLVRRRVFRPLLVVLAAAVTLWGLNASWLAERNIVDFSLTIIVAALVYAVFAWFAKIRQFWLSLSVLTIIIVIFRVMTML